MADRRRVRHRSWPLSHEAYFEISDLYMSFLSLLNIEILEKMCLTLQTVMTLHFETVIYKTNISLSI